MWNRVNLGCVSFLLLWAKLVISNSRKKWLWGYVIRLFFFSSDVTLTGCQGAATSASRHRNKAAGCVSKRKACTTATKTNTLHPGCQTNWNSNSQKHKLKRHLRRVQCQGTGLLGGRTTRGCFASKDISRTCNVVQPNKWNSKSKWLLSHLLQLVTGSSWWWAQFCIAPAWWTWGPCLKARSRARS